MRSLTLSTVALLSGSIIPVAAQEIPAQQFTIVVDSVQVGFELEGPAVVSLADEIRHTAEAAFTYHLGIFGSLPKQILNSPDRRITIAILQADELRGESEPTRVDMTMPSPREAIDHVLWRGVLAHEIFHLWNAEGFRYASVEEQWLSEGFTQYYTLRTLGRMGVLDEPTFLYVLGRLLGMYLTDPGLGSISMREAGPTKQEHTGLVEGGGLAIALCLDVEIRVASGGQRSLDDVMRLLFARHDATGRRYGLDEVADYVEAIRGEDRSDFFHDYVAGKASLPLNECLAPAGMSLRIEDGVAEVVRIPNPGEPATQLLNAVRGL